MRVKVRKINTFLILFLAVVVTGCGGGDTTTPPQTPVTLTSISISPADPSIAPGTTQQFTATANYSNGYHALVTSSATWASSNSAVADAGSNGLTTATTTTGSTTISAAYGGISGATTLTVSPVASLAVTPANPPSIAPGTTLQFAAVGTLADSAIQTLTTWAAWTSSDTNIATVSNNAGSEGLASAIYPVPGVTNNATITASYSGASGTATLTSSALLSIAVTPTTASIAKGTTQQFTALGALTSMNTQDLTAVVTWSTSSSGVATISSIGQATAVSVGTATIASSFTGILSEPVTLIVTPEVLTSLTVTPVNPTIAFGRTQQFIATGTFSDNSTKNLTSSVTWTSSATAVATISNVTGSNGLATSLGAGITTIRADSGSISDSTTLTVIPELVSITVSPATASVVKNGFQQFTAMGDYTDGSNKDLTTSAVWKSSATTIAIISNKGIATALFTSGTATITATMSGITSNAAILTVQ